VNMIGGYQTQPLQLSIEHFDVWLKSCQKAVFLELSSYYILTIRIPVMLNPRRGSRAVTDIRLRHPHIYKLFNIYESSCINRYCRKYNNNSKDFRKASKLAVFKSLITSGLKYCSVVWTLYYDVYKRHLESIQKKFLWHLSSQSGM
jgi:hypothetical protein